MYKDSGAWIDVFPCAPYRYNTNIKNAEELRRYLQVYEFKNRTANSNNKLDSDDKLCMFTDSLENADVIFDMPFNTGVAFITETDNIFPLSEIVFEDNKFPTPHIAEKYLADRYGDDFMSFPRSGILHHSRGTKISEKYDQFDEKMQIFKDELIALRDSIV